MRVFNHHIYEYKKGLRNLVLHTMPSALLAEAERKLQGNKIDYIVQHVTPEKVNVFFGASECIHVIRHFKNKNLNELTPEEDFILGIMLGYGRLQQCNRYLGRVGLSKPKLAVV